MRTICAIAVLLTLSACADVAIVEPGHGAVVMPPDGHLFAADEGAVSIAADSIVDDFNLRQQDQGGSFVAITADGVPIGVSDPVVSWRWVGAELVNADRELGAQAASGVVASIVGATTARVLADYRWDALDPAHLREAQARIVADAAAGLRPHHLELLSVELKGITPRLPELARAVTGTSIWEQRAAQARSAIELARQNAERRRADAQGIAAANSSVAPTLTPPVLQQKRDLAWQQLLASPRTAVEVSNEPLSNLEVAP